MDKKIWKARIKKAYADATNHIVVGEVLEATPLYIRMKCKAYHFKKPIQTTDKQPAGIFVSDAKVRIFPWQVISYITELPEDFNWEEAVVELTGRGEIILKQNETNITIKGGGGWTNQ